MKKAQHELVIMVVEDHGFQRKALLHQVRSLGYQNLLEAADGAEALVLSQQHAVDILFCDLRMPGMDGMALLRRLSLGGFRGGIILSSALEDDVVEAVLRMSAAYGLQVLGRIEKPSTQQQLKLLIDAWSPREEPAREEEGHRIGLDELCRALEQDQLLPWYQPKVSFASGEWVGMEALARWQHPEYGLISPGRFIPLAERNGLIDQLTEVIIGKSLSDGHLWEETGLSLNLSMNLSTTSLIEGDLCNSLINQCQRWSINPELITLEVTESAFVQDLGKSLEVLTRLRMHGFGLSIDDFGTGYSSMQQLALLPFTELKLDRSFVDRCHADPSRLAIIESSIELARKLGLKSVAEGVEDEATWRVLAQLGCDLCQGFFSARPMPRSELAKWHRTWQDRLPTLISI
ncbi:EAL domain-containing response regulator [Aeromonas veronii]|uniref:EAL domain-containing response regulator n=1 Tax=Aeromonas TaxID=642 RepID=UPI0022EA915F|nr:MULTISPECIES: EAL domain-containing response regulator [Aeromonas]KAJ8742410.1 EAL domain-containing response regulator [Aeromonas veronii]MDA3315742.1 EAL domain-containing response regulator [Aeromonas sp. PI_26]